MTNPWNFEIIDVSNPYYRGDPMGTRNLTKVINEAGDVVVAQYGQWDGYPSYSGVRMLNFISEYNMLDKIKTALSKCRFGSEEELEAIYNTWNDNPMANEYGAFAIQYPSLARDTGVDILKTIVYSNGEVLLSNQAEFENDDLFCEGVYTLNFQTQEFLSWFNSDMVVVKFDNLLSEEEYISAWKALTPTP